jgi:RNA polymerase sigma-70 factor (ECF subfamily)
VSYASGTVNCGARACGGNANARPLASGGLNKNALRASRGSTNHPSRTRVRARPEGQQREAVQEMLLASRPRFVRLAYAILRNKEDAEDAVQDASLSAYLNLRTFEGRSALTTWFTRILLNAALVIRRKRKNARVESFSESCTTDDAHWMENVPASQPDPEMCHAEGETFQLIDHLLVKMNPILRQAFTMTYYDELSNEDACALLGIRKGTFKSRLSRARQYLMNRAERCLVAPIRGVARPPFSQGKNDFQSFAARAAVIPSHEIRSS